MVFVGCSTRYETDYVSETEYSIGGYFRRAEIERVFIDVDDNYKTYKYVTLGMPDSSFINLTKEDLNTDTVLFWYNEVCKLRGHLTVNLGTEDYLIKRYILDSQMAEDDASAIYFVSGYGLLSIKSIDWGGYSLFYRELDHSNSLIQTLLSDSTGFFNRIPRGVNWNTGS